MIRQRWVEDTFTKMMNELGRLLALSIIATAVVLVSSAGQEKEDVYVPHGNNRAVVEHNGRVSGREQDRLNKAKEAERKQKEKGGVPTPESEGAILEFHELYTKYLKRCARLGNSTRLTRRLKKSLAANNVTEEEAEDECLQRYEANIVVTGGGRQKRSNIANWAGVWDKCIIPYQIDASLPQAYADTLVQQTMALYEKYTGFRFKVYDGNNAQWGLEHDNYLKFILGNGCWSSVGNRRINGQSISPCSQLPTQVHEIGHAIGFNHEQKHPISMDYVNINWQDIDPNYQSQYFRDDFDDLYNDDKFFDISSTMHYANWGFNINHGTTMRANDPDLDYMVGMDNFFYLFRDIQPYHSCFDEFPETCSSPPVCQNGGYLTVLDGACACRCPEGLESATNCATTIKPAYPTQWPDGTFTLLKSTDGDCPSGFASGRLSYTNKEWTWEGGVKLSPGYANGYTWEMDMCTQTSSSNAGLEWEKGEYCILRYGGTCPTGFSDGLIEAYGNTPPTGGNTGTLSDGEHGAKQQFRFCCREDGTWQEPIQLPITRPFILYRTNYWGCQEVEGMVGVDEFYNLNGDANSAPEFSGELPYYYAWNPGQFNTYYCAYYPKADVECNVIKEFGTNEGPYKIETPNYPSDFGAGSSCMWHFKSPEGTTMRLDFVDFEMPEVDQACDSYIELKTYYPGMPGYQYCGTNNIRSRWTYLNQLTVKLRGVNPAKGFSGLVTVVKDEEKCYTGNGLDGSYSGTLNYTRYFNPCLPWNEVTDCLYNQFDARMVDVDLNHNYCRNVGTGQMPWCYVERETCRRENCDACMQGRCMDIADDCASRVSQDSDYCDKNVLGEAMRLCKDTCGGCASHTPMPPVTQVTCSAPGDVSCISPEPARTSYRVGDSVRYSCPYSDDVRTRTCTSDGTWTNLNIVCNSCPSGWSVAEGRCFKWLGWDQMLTNSEAVAACSAIGGQLPKVDSEEISNHMLTLADISPEDDANIWLGVKRVDGTFVWSDGSAITYNRWYSESGLCAVGGFDWYGESCNYAVAQTVCEYIPSDTTVCADNAKDCMATLERMPDMCEAQPDYAWQSCRETCAVGDCDFPITCADEGVSGNGARVSAGSGPINQGQYLEYECDVGHYLSAGNLKRACLPSGQLTGQQPNCTPPAQTPRLPLFSDRELLPRDAVDSGWVQILPDRTAMAIPMDGTILEWSFYSNYNYKAAFQIWRPTADPLRFILVGQNVIETTEDGGKQRVQIPKDQQIAAKAGDLIGIVSGGSIHYSRCEQEYEPENTNWHYSSRTYNAPGSELTAGNEYDFKKEIEYYECKKFSVQLVLSPCNSECL